MAPPDITVAVAAYSQVRAWLDVDKVPAPEAPTAGDPSGVHAVGVVLRLGGRVVGMGKAITPEKGLLSRATQQALATARQDAAVRAIGEGAVPRLTLELEIGGSPQPLVGGTFEEALATLQPAAQGLALRNGDSWAYLPTSIVLARGLTSPLSGSVLALILELRLPQQDLPELRTGASTAIYAVPAVRLRQLRPDAVPAALHRLNTALPTEPLADEDMARVAQLISARLAKQVEPRSADSSSSSSPALKLGLTGSYNPLADEFRETAASPSDQALCAYALARAADCPTWSAVARAQAREGAIRVLEQLAQVEEGEQNPTATTTGPTSSITASFSLLAVETLRNSPANHRGVTGTPTAERSAFVPAQFERALVERVVSAIAKNDPTNATARAIALAAAAACQRAGRDVLPLAELSGALQDAWNRADRNSILTSVPWLLVAERALFHSSPAEASAATARIGTQRALLDSSLAALIGTQAAAQGDATTPPDAWGAYPVTQHGTLRATAKSASAMYLVALLRSTPRSGATDQIVAASRSLRCGARFLAQLQAGPSLEYAMRSPERAIGGIMAAPYDSLIEPTAQGMALLALVEAQDAPAKPTP